MLGFMQIRNPKFEPRDIKAVPVAPNSIGKLRSAINCLPGEDNGTDTKTSPVSNPSIILVHIPASGEAEGLAVAEGVGELVTEVDGGGPAPTDDDTVAEGLLDTLRVLEGVLLGVGLIEFSATGKFASEHSKLKRSVLRADGRSQHDTHNLET